MANPAARSALLAYTGTIFLSALLLFSVQPMIAKMVLPVLGGAPATWAVSLCFFQAVLLLGYAYAHLIGTRLPRRAALALHGAVLAAALLMLPIGLPVWFGPPPADAYFWLMALLAVSVGAPFFALSATAPLLQAWFAGLGHDRSASPYFLYAASNAGSLAALLAYPTVIEPLLPLTVQAQVWAACFLVLALMIAGCGVLMLTRDPPLLSSAAASVPSNAIVTKVDWRDRLGWVVLAFVPSGLLVACTTFLTTDLASAPLLWVIPLALFLATFIIVFRDPPLVSPRLMLVLQPIVVAVVMAASEWSGSLSWAAACLAGVLAFLVTCLVCHGELYQRRPAPDRLTDFYLWMSLGGVLGGIFAALLAPLLFTNVLEFPLLLGAGLACRPAVWRAANTPRAGLELALLLGAAGGLILLIDHLVGLGIIPQSADLRLHAIAALGVATIAAFRWPRLQLALAVAMILGFAMLAHASAPVHVTRSFFGTHRVVDTGGGAYRLLLHGTTLHGIQHNTEPGPRPTPLGYYHATGPLAHGLALARAAAGSASQPIRVGIVGLGIGALACYAEPGDRWRFFEIDPAVAAIATNPKYFRFLSACVPDAEIVLGDARLTLAREPAGTFDVLVIDAFSSDAIPIHLLTVEALRLYEGLLSRRGILLLHISNQNLDLPPVVEANLAALAELKGVYAEGERGGGALASQVVLIARQGEILAPALRLPNARRLGDGTIRPWTDDYSDILSAVIRRYRAKLGWGGP